MATHVDRGGPSEEVGGRDGSFQEVMFGLAAGHLLLKLLRSLAVSLLF